MQLVGWIEVGGRRLTCEEVEELVHHHPEAVQKFGGEFCLAFGNCRARDHFGIIPADIPPGSIVCDGQEKGAVDPDPEPLGIEEAIPAAVRLRSDEGIVAFSGGLDSSLIAGLAELECVTVGLEGSHDLRRGEVVAERLGLSHTSVVVTQEEIEEALHAAARAIPALNPVTASIAATLYFVARYAGDQGHRRVLTGQGADELFGGYSRYLRSEDLEAELARDFLALQGQVVRDQAIALMHRTIFSLPYLDVRVVRAAHAIPAREKVMRGIRKMPLRLVAEHYMPSDIAWYEKKAMQYGSGIWRAIRTLARQKGYKGVEDYISGL